MDQERHHVFISYPHVENAIFPGTEEGWVTTFRNGLKICLDARLGRTDAGRIWFDDGTLRRGHELRGQIEDVLSRTEAIVVLLAPGYFQSDWCLWEQETFCRLHADDLDGRVFVVEIDRIEEAARAALAFKNRAAHTFWAMDSSGRSRCIGKPTPTRQDRDYHDKVADLAFEIAGSIREREQRGAAGSPAATPDAAGETLIAVAEVTDELEPRRESLLRRLRDAGLRCAPLDSYGRSTEDFVASLDATLAQATHFVQLLGGHAGKARPGAPNGYPQLQFERAIAAASAPRLLQWRDPALVVAEIEDSAYRDLLETATVQAISFDKFREAVVAVASEKPKPPAIVAAAVAATGSAPSYIFVNYDQRDSSVATEIFDQISRDATGMGPPLTDDPEEYRLGLETEMLECDQMMIIFGQSGPNWVDMQLRLLNRTMHKRRKQLKEILVLRTPPNDRPLPPVRFPGLRMVDWRDGMKLSDIGVSFA